MTRNAVYLDLLLVEQDVVTNLQYGNGTVEVCTHEVGQVELVIGRANHHGAAFLHSRDGFTRDVVVGHHATAVSVTR